jgi:nitrite reductase (NADH) small subunit
MPVVLVPLGEPDGRERWTVSHDGRDYLVLRREEGYVVTDALCPHKATPLIGGLVREDALVCPGHWYAFDLATGECRNAREDPLRLYPAVERDGELVARVTVEAPRSWAERLRAHAADPTSG